MATLTTDCGQVELLSSYCQCLGRKIERTSKTRETLQLNAMSLRSSHDSAACCIVTSILLLIITMQKCGCGVTNMPLTPLQPRSIFCLLCSYLCF